MSRIIAFVVWILLFTGNTVTAQTQAQVEKHLNTAISAIKNKDIKAWSTLFPDDVMMIKMMQEFNKKYEVLSYDDSILNQISNEGFLIRRNININKSFLKIFPKKDDDIENIFTKWDDLKLIHCDYANDIRQSNDGLYAIFGAILFQSITNPMQYYIGRFDDIFLFENQVFGLDISVKEIDNKEEYLLVKKELAEYSKSDYEKIADSYDTVAAAEAISYDDSMMDPFDRIYRGMIDADSIELRFIQEPSELNAYYFDYKSQETIYLRYIKLIDQGIYRMDDIFKQGYWLVTINEKYVKGVFLKNDTKGSEIALISLQTIE